MRLKVSPTPSNTPSYTPTITPTGTQCPGICFSGVGTNAIGTVFAIQQDVNDPTKMAMVGQFTSLNGVSRDLMVRAYTDGEVDLTFNPGTSFGIFGLNEFPKEFVQQPDGKYIVVGTFTTFSGVSTNRIARLNYNGTLDTSFVIGTGFTRETTYASLDTGNKILVCGFGDNQYSGTPTGMICRLNTNGSLDTTFSNNAIPGTSVNFISKVIKNSDGTYYVSGNFTHVGRANLIKLNSDGTYASTDPFNTSGVGFNGRVNDFEILPDGKLICVGDMNRYNGVNIPRGIIRLNPNGTRDTSFVLGGYSNYQHEVIVQGDKYISVGFAFLYSGIPINNITRLNPNGTLDTTWNSGNFTSLTTEDAIQHLYQITGATNDAGYIFCAGFFDSYDGVLTSNIVKLDRNGYAVDCDPILVSPTPTPSQTRTPTPTNTSTPTQTPTNTETPTPTNTSTPTQTPTNTETPTPTPTNTSTQTPTNTSTQTPTNTETPTPTPTNTETPTQTPTQTNTPSPTCACLKYELSTSFTNPVYTYTGCDGIVRNIQIGFFSTFDICALSAPTGGFSTFLGCCDVVPTPPPTNTQTRTPTPTPTNTRTPTATPTQTQTSTQGVTPTNTETPTPTPTQTQTSTPQVSPTTTQTPTTTSTSTPTQTPTELSCQCYQAINTTEEPLNITYTPCGDSESTVVIPANGTLNFCVEPNTLIFRDEGISNPTLCGIECEFDGVDCSTC
jgi:uncharacterized delta-60 repeat protein